jgi:zinc protease
MKSLRLAVFGLLVLPCAVMAQGFPATPPQGAPVAPAEFPPFQEATLPNGLRLVVVQRSTQPVVSVSLSMPAGSRHDPRGKEGLAGMTAGLLTRGASGRTAEQVSAAIEGVGGFLGAAADNDFITVRSDVLRPHAKLAFQLIADAVTAPTFAASELELARTQTLSAIQLSLSQPSALASRFLTSGLYGTHPYGALPTPASIRAISREDLLAFQQARIKPQGALLIVAGDMSLATARELAQEAFGRWSGKPAPAPDAGTPTARSTREILLVHRPSSVQASLAVGNLTGGPADPRRYAATVANEMLGVGSEGRLFRILREQRGWTYDANSGFVRPAGTGYFQARADVRTEVADSALIELLAQLRRIANEPANDAEIGGVKSALAGRFPLQVETASQVAGQVARSILLGLPGDYLRNYRMRLASVTPTQARDAAKAMIRPEQALIVVVGDAEKLKDKLAPIAPVRVVDAEGNALNLSAPSAGVTPASVKLDMSRLAARSDSFAILVQGNPMGGQRSSIEKVADGWRYVENTQIGPIVQQTTELLFTAEPRMRSVKQSGKVQGQELKVEVAYSGGRAKGSATTPGPQGPATKSVDMEIPPHVLDDNAITPLVPALPWAPGAKFTLPVFSAGEGAIKQRTLTVAGTEQVTVPAGTFKTYRVDVTGGQGATLFVTTDAPHRLVKIAPAAMPIEFVLVK